MSNKKQKHQILPRGQIENKKSEINNKIKTKKVRQPSEDMFIKKGQDFFYVWKY